MLSVYGTRGSQLRGARPSPWTEHWRVKRVKIDRSLPLDWIFERERSADARGGQHKIVTQDSTTQPTLRKPRGDPADHPASHDVIALGEPLGTGR